MLAAVNLTDVVVVLGIIALILAIIFFFRRL